MIPYSVLQDELDLPEIKAIEDIIMDCIYSGLIQARLDERKQHVYSP